MSETFSKGMILEKQRKQQEEYEKKVDELRKSLKRIVDTEDGEHFLRYLFLLCGGNSTSARRDKDGKLDTMETWLVLGAKTIWENIRFNMDSDTIKKVERQIWED